MGRRVHHRTFGAGTVTAQQGNKLTIDFDVGTTKVLISTTVVDEGAASAAGAPATYAAATPELLAPDPLLDAVLANPADADACAAYAEALIARGDPRGEVMRLDPDTLTSLQTKQVRDIERKHGARWIAALEPMLGAHTFRCGFLDTATVLHFQTPAQKLATLGHPLLRTVRELISLAPEVVDELLTHPGLVSLERASLTGAALSKLAARAEPAPLVAVIAARSHAAVSFDGDPRGLPFPHGPSVDHPAAWSGALQIGALVNLRALTLWLAPDDDTPVEYGRGNRGPTRVTHAQTDARRMAWLLDAPLGRQLEILDIAIGNADDAELHLAGWIDAVAALPRMRRVTLRMRYETLAPRPGALE